MIILLLVALLVPPPGPPPGGDLVSVVDPEGNRLYDRSAWIERLAWRTVCMILFVLGLIMFVSSGGTWLYLAFVVGGLVPGLFLMAREQSERHIEAQRPPWRPRAGTTSCPRSAARDCPDRTPRSSAATATTTRPQREPVPYGGRPYDDDDAEPVAGTDRRRGAPADRTGSGQR